MIRLSIFVLSISIFLFARCGQNRKTGIDVAYYCHVDKIEEIYDINSKAGTPLPDSLIIDPGLYSIENQTFDMTKEGLYRFLNVGEVNYQRIVYRKDTLSLVSSLAWLHSHGNTDNHISFNELLKKATNDKIFLTCTQISDFTQKILTKKDIPNRIVATLTLDKWNNYDNGHTMIEVFIENRWRVVDIDNNSYFMYEGEYLNLLEFIEGLKKNSNIIINHLSNDFLIELPFKLKNDYNYTFWAEANLTDSNIMKWYKRVAQVGFVKDSIFYYTSDTLNKNKIESYSNYYKVITKKIFMEKYYNENTINKTLH